MKVNVGVGAAIISDKKILLTKRLKTDKTFPSHWTFPAGGFEESDEFLINTAIREVKEEVGLDFTPTDKLNFYECSHDDILSISHVYLGKFSGEIKAQESEVSEVKWFSYSEAKDLALAFAYREVIEDLHDLGLID